MKKLVEKYLGFEVSEEQYQESADAAAKKLVTIIDRFGDEGGERNKPYYLAQLIAEHIRISLLTQASILVAVNVLNMEKEHSANAEVPYTTNHIVAQDMK